MSQTLELSDDVYERLTRAATARGITIRSLLRVVSDVVVPRIPATAQDRRRGERIERLFEKYRDASLGEAERAELNRLIDEEYRIALQRADARIAAKLAATKKRSVSKSLRGSRRPPGDSRA
jgi:hypothetical protein